MTPQAFKQLMRLHPAAVNIIATGKTPYRTGMTVSAFMSLGVEPPTVVCAINRNAFSYAHMADNQVFSVNTLAVEHIALAKPRCLAMNALTSSNGAHLIRVHLACAMRS